MNRRFRTYAEITEPAGAEILQQVDAQSERLRSRLSRIRNVIVVASGKGGVGKSFITAQLAARLAERGRAIGVLDADLNGPSLATMLGLTHTPLRVDEEGVHPIPGRGGCRAISADLLLQDEHTPLRWRTPQGLEFLHQSLLETGAVRELISDVAWGDLDALLIDLPPGTAQVTRLAGLLGDIALLLMVTTPSRMTERVVARALTHARELGITQLGVVMNMDGFCCPGCGHHTSLFPTIPPASGAPGYWGRIPFDPSAAQLTDSGQAVTPGSAVDRALSDLADRVLEACS